MDIRSSLTALYADTQTNTADVVLVRQFGGSEDEKQAFFCERKEGKEDVEEWHIDWRYSNLDDIINIKMKGE